MFPQEAVTIDGETRDYAGRFLLFGRPKMGTANLKQAPTLAIDAPFKALIWQDEGGKVWLTYNSSEYVAKHVFPRHGLTLPE